MAHHEPGAPSGVGSLQQPCCHDGKCSSKIQILKQQGELLLLCCAPAAHILLSESFQDVRVGRVTEGGVVGGIRADVVRGLCTLRTDEASLSRNHLCMFRSERALSMHAMRCLAYDDCFGRRLAASLAFRRTARCSSCRSSCVLARGFRRSGDLLSIEPFCLEALLCLRALSMASLASVARPLPLRLGAKLDRSCPDSADSQSPACACSLVPDIPQHGSVPPRAPAKAQNMWQGRRSCPRRGQATCAHDHVSKACHFTHGARL